MVPTFRISSTGAFETVAFFDYTNGPGPIGKLALGADGNFYGTTVAGGYDGEGALYRLVSPPLLTSITPTGGNVTITWTSFTNGLYRVEYKTALRADRGVVLAHRSVLPVAVAALMGQPRLDHRARCPPAAAARPAPALADHLRVGRQHRETCMVVAHDSR